MAKEKDFLCRYGVGRQQVSPAKAVTSYIPLIGRGILLILYECIPEGGEVELCRSRLTVQ